jgi:1-hydroxycarotenoid 3,4-desaturase
MKTHRAVVIGAGIAGLVAALGLARRGLEVVVCERARSPGGKMREVTACGRALDAGPTVLTMRRVFDEIFADAGTSLDDHLRLKPLTVLARHAWSERERLDLYPDMDRTTEAIGAFAGPSEGQGYRRFCERARRVFETLEGPFIRSERPSVASLIAASGFRGLGDLWRIRPFATLWGALGDYFRDPRLRQLFGRYATYCGSSPFAAPATLMLVAHVERDGVWRVEGGMHRIALALADLATAHGATIRYGASVIQIVLDDSRVAGVEIAGGERIGADMVIVNADSAALGAGLFGEQVKHAVPRLPASARSLSAVTWAFVGSVAGFPLVRHNVFFSGNYRAEFEDILGRHALPVSPTVYVCAEDRDDEPAAATPGAERLFCLVNAPATGDSGFLKREEIERCQKRTFGLLRHCGLATQPEEAVLTTPQDFEGLFPGTGGALYGPASHGWTASFRRPGSRTRIPGLYLAGGSAHPGPGVPMAAISGRLAAACLMKDIASTARSRRAATAGGMSTR